MHFQSLSTGVLAILSLSSIVKANSEECISHSLPNPIFQKFPGNVTGTVNATIAILPIPLSLARSIIPSKYAILTHQYKAFLPEFPEDKYPAILQTVRDHDIKFGDYGIPDFSRASIDFPFVDLLGDGQTSFRWSPTMFISANAPMAIAGAGEYGTTVYPSTFDPECNAYESTESGATYLKIAGGDSNDVFIDTLFEANEPFKLNPGTFPMQFFVNATNQPSFGDGTICDEYVRFFDTEISQGEHAAVPVTGTVRAKLNVFAEEMTWENAVGVRVDTAFIEGHLVSCEGLKGYTGTGEQDVEIAKPISESAKGNLSKARKSCRTNTCTAGWSRNSTFAPFYNGLQEVIANLVAPLTGGNNP